MKRPEVAYPGVFTPDSGGWVVEFPDLPGCVTEGDTWEDAVRNAQDALTGVLEANIVTGYDFPVNAIAPPVGPGRKVVWIEPAPHVAVPLLIRKARQDLGISQEEMAHRMGISPTSYQHLEYPRRFNATIRNIEKVARALGVAVRVEFTPRSLR